MTASEIEDALLAHEPPIEPRFRDTALLEAERNPKLYDCTPESFVAAVAISERLELPVDRHRGVAFLTVERDPGGALEALFLPGYPAFDLVMRRDAEILFTATGIVHDRDDFRQAVTSVSRELVPGAPRLSGFLGGLAALAGVRLPEDGFRHVRFPGPDPGPVTHIYAEAHYRNGAVKRDVMRRRDFEGKTPETGMDSEASEARNWGNTDGLEKLRGIALKRLAKGLERTVEMGTLIYLARGAEKARYRPRSLDAARSLGIFVQVAPPELRGASPEVEQLAREVEVEEERVAALSIHELERSAGSDFECRLGTCCECRQAKQVRGHENVTLTKECPGMCVYHGGRHKLCHGCYRKLLTSLRKADRAKRAEASREPKGSDSSSVLTPESRPTVAAEVRSDTTAASALSHVDPDPTPAYGLPVEETK